MPILPPPSLTAEAARWYAPAALWQTLQRVARVAGRKVLSSALVLFFCLKDRDTPLWAKGVITGALGYLILPADLVPDLLPGAGYGDDWGALVAALGTVTAHIKDEHKRRAAVLVAQMFREPQAAAPDGFFE